ncbi:hypothetical protein PYW07_000532 [Mythimna separata]|uniref:Uncharacterized protein n=1 Tax=Mythimna separata TaxID=271217 RepID=A0AAD8E0M5_MYTSE|nr:hypothetical protein PYW07_000532 [Mythimna separata]
MARALLLALACAACASAARYVDYGGVKMPAYGAGDYEAAREPGAAPSYDYRGHSPDAPASPDYKYEESPRVKTEKPAKDSDEAEGWRKPGRKQRGLLRPPIDKAEEARAHPRGDDDPLAPRAARDRHAKHRSRLKSDAADEPARRPAKYSRDRKDDISDIDNKDYFPVDKDDFSDDKSKEFEEDVKFANVATTRRARRKPRDRFMKRKSNDLDMMPAYDVDDELDRRVKEGEEELRRRVKEGEEELRRTRPPVMEGVPQAVRARPRERFLPPDDEEDVLQRAMPPGAGAHKPKPYEDYDDYYDMKRVHSIKSKLPSLMRRTTESAGPPPPTRYLDMLWTHRRLLPNEDAAPSSTPSTARVPSPRPRTPTEASTAAARRTLASSTTTPTPTPTSTIPTTTTANATALSLAEKSRLSILKKDQRKKGQHMDAPTLKPPVLLQVTHVLPTVVMVEPPSSAHPWLRMRELSEDSPERIEKVKKMMRHKLVADAKSIHDLTNNWDEMVCDYVDVALLDAQGQVAARPPLAPVAPVVSVAERELKAALGALGARRKEPAEPASLLAAPLPAHAPRAPTTTTLAPTFPPAAVPLDANQQWNDFILTNSCPRLHLSIYVTSLALINCLQRYEYGDISVRIALLLS